MHNKPPTIAILATGDEIVEGDVLNTNAYHFAHALSLQGLQVVTQLSCRDIEAEILSSLHFVANHDIVITIGGLGPTVDDLTRFALSKYLDQTLIEYPEAITHIQSRVSSMRPNQYREALFPKHHTTLIPNAFGTALGAMIQHQQQLLVMLPGPPRECLPMWENHVLPYLSNHYPHQNTWQRWLLFGVAEASIALDIAACLAGEDYDIAYRLSLPYLEVKVKAKNMAAITAKLTPLFAPFTIADSQQRAAAALRHYLAQHDILVSIDDNMTHGLLESMLFTPILAQKISFSRMFTHHFSFKGLESYWQQKTDADTLIATYLDSSEHYQTLIQDDVRMLAAEWACGVILRHIRI